MGAYAVRDDVYTLALSAQAFVTRPRAPESFDATNVSTTTGIIRLVAHGFAAADLVYLTATSGGALPTGLAALTVYSPIPISADLFKLAATPNGTPIVPSTVGAGWSVAVDPGRRLDAHLLEAAAEIDEHLTAHDPPLLVDPLTGKFPQVIIGINARMAARAAVTSLQIENAAYKVATDRLFAKEEFDKLILADWKSGKPVHPRPTDKDEIADNGARASSARVGVGWQTGCL